LGDKYEAARIKFKNPNAPPAAAKGKAATKKAPAKRKRANDDDNDEATGVKRTRKSAPASKGDGNQVPRDEEDEDEDADQDEEPTRAKKAPELLLANKWDLEKGIDPTGWWISEKLDGVRHVLFLIVHYRMHISSIVLGPTSTARQ